MGSFSMKNASNLRQAAGGDGAAGFTPPLSEGFVREVVRHQDRLRELIRCLLFNPQDVDDVWQETNVVLLKKASDFRLGSDFWAWSSQVARYQVLSHCRRVRQQRLIFSEELLAALADDLEGRRHEIDQRQLALDACVASLPAPQRKLVELRYAPNASINEIAAALGRPAGSIRQTLYRIREALLACVERRLVAEGAS
jgi:RNA polymerase sigma-70 factor (ECF subfamily)